MQSGLNKPQSVHLNTRQILYQQSCFRVKYHLDTTREKTIYCEQVSNIISIIDLIKRKMKLLDWSVFGCRRCVSCRVWSTELWPGVGACSAWWELFLSDRGGILPPSLLPSPLFLPLLHTRCKIWCTPAARLKERNKHRHTCTKAAASWKCAKWFWKRGEAASLWCVTQISAELSVCRKKTSLLLWIHKGSRLCSLYVRRTRRSALNVWREWSHFHSFVCLFHLSALPSLAVAVSVYYQDTGWVGSTAPPAIPPSFSWKTASICTFLL